MYYEVLWYEDEEQNNPQFKEFKTKKQALAFYEKHKDEPNHYSWWVTKRDSDGEVVNDIIY